MSVVAYHFWSPTCGPCRVIKPGIDALKEDFPNVTWLSINTHEDKEGYARRLNVPAVPTIVFARDGMEVGRHSGTNMIMYYTLVRKALGSA
jgi:thiol-disulfide isomerase/thioredoxin